MPIQFDKSRWEAVVENYSRWWDGELRRPLIHLTITGTDPGREKPKLPWYEFTSRYGLETPVGDIIDAWDYELCGSRFLGDSFPCTWPNFGPGVVAAFMGARLEAREETTWFHPEKKVSGLEQLSFSFNPENVWFNRVKEVGRAACERWQGIVQIGMTDLGGELDILSTFRPGSELLLDTLMCPGEITRVSREIHDVLWKCFNEVNAVLRLRNPGYTSWAPIFSAQPFYMLQCDFAYMIGPDMFDDLVKPCLEDSCAKLTNPFYHLDGTGQLAHLDSLLAIEKLKGIQWVPGEGQPDCSHWVDVYRRIRDAGKLVQIMHGGMKEFDMVAQKLGSAEGLVFILTLDASKEREGREFLSRYGC